MIGRGLATDDLTRKCFTDHDANNSETSSIVVGGRSGTKASLDNVRKTACTNSSKFKK